MNKKWFIGSVILVISLVFLSACKSDKSGGEKGNNKIDSEQQSQVIDGYEEQKYEMPEGLEAIVPCATRMAEGIGLMVLGMKDDEYYLWISEDNGKTWGQPIELPEELKGKVSEGVGTAGQRSIMSASISDKGEIAFIRATYYENNNYICDYWTWKQWRSRKKVGYTAGDG